VGAPSLAGGPPFGFGFLSNNTTVGAPSLRFLQEPALSGVEGVGGDAADAFQCQRARREGAGLMGDQTATHPSRKAREGWGTRCIVVPAEGWGTRPVTHFFLDRMRHSCFHYTPVCVGICGGSYEHLHPFSGNLCVELVLPSSNAGLVGARAGRAEERGHNNRGGGRTAVRGADRVLTVPGGPGAARPPPDQIQRAGERRLGPAAQRG